MRCCTVETHYILYFNQSPPGIIVKPTSHAIYTYQDLENKRLRLGEYSAMKEDERQKKKQKRNSASKQRGGISCRFCKQGNFDTNDDKVGFIVCSHLGLIDVFFIGLHVV